MILYVRLHDGALSCEPNGEGEIIYISDALDWYASQETNRTLFEVSLISIFHTIKNNRYNILMEGHREEIKSIIESQYPEFCL